MSLLYMPANRPSRYVCDMEIVMDTMYMEQDVRLAATAPVSFPDGIGEALASLRRNFPDDSHRQLFGLSRPDETGTIRYRSAVRLLMGEEYPSGMDSILLPSGKYAYFDIADFMNNISWIGETFKRLITLPDIDPEGYCIEWYTGAKDVRCMVRLKE